MDDDTLTQLTDAANVRLATLWQDLDIALSMPRISRGMVRCVVEALEAAQPPTDPVDAPAPQVAPKPRKHTPESRAKMRAAAQRRMAQPGERERLAALGQIARQAKAAAADADGDGPPPSLQLLATVPSGATCGADAPTHHGRPHGAMAVDDAAVIAEMRRLAADGYMPTRIDYDERRGDAPHSNTLLRLRAWSDWARLAGLKLQRGSRPAAEKTPPAATRLAARKAAAIAARHTLLERARPVLAGMAAARDNHMPTLAQYDAAKPDDLPLGGELLQRLGLASWGELAHACGLAYRNGEHVAQPLAQEE